MAFNIIGSTSSGGTVRYYGGYTYTPSSYPPPSDSIPPVYNNSDSSVYMTYNNTKYYNSAVLNYNGSTHVFFFFTQSISCVRGYYNDSAWTTVSATATYGNCYSTNSIDTISLDGVLIPQSGNLSVGSFIDTDLPVFTSPADFLNYIKNPVPTYTELIRYHGRYSSYTYIRLLMKSTPIIDNPDSSWSFTNHSYTIMNSAICIGDVAGDGNNRICLALLSATNDVVIYSQHSNDGTNWTTGSTFTYTTEYNNGTHIVYSSGGISKFNNSGVIYNSNLDQYTEIYSVGTGMPVFTNTSEYMNYIQNPIVSHNSFVIGEKTDSYGIYWLVGDPYEQPKTGQEILNYMTTQGCNVGFLYDAGTYTHGGHYQLFLFNANLLNGDLYLCIDVPNGSSNYFGVCKNGGSGVVSGQRDRVLRGYLPNTEFYDNSYQPNSWSNNLSYNNKVYAAHKGTSNPNKPTVFFTTLNYIHLYLNDQDITPLVYNWQPVIYIEGNGKTYLLSNIFNINNGNPVNNVSAQGNLNLVSQTEVDSLISEVALDMSKVKVTYSIPSGTYSYIKLVYKRGSKPTSVSDGTAITITQASTEQIIDGIADGGTYWFVIFTDISKSNAMSIETEAVPMILWDKDLGVKHPMCSDYVSVKQNYDAYLWEFIDTYRLVGSGSNTPPGAGNTSITFQKGIKRKYATKMYIEIQCSRSYTLQWANSAMRLADTKTATGALPSGYLRVNFVSGNSGGVTDNYTHTTPYYTLPKMLIEIDISSVGADTMWYLAFWKCNEYTEITKCYFNAPVEIES